MIWLQHWTDVLFLHFAARADELEARLPPGVEIDTIDGQAWLSLVLFRLKLRPAGLPFILGCSSLLELNVRTYVRHRGQSGIYFLRMLSNNWLAIRAARLLTPLCYEVAVMRDRRTSNGLRHVECRPANAGGHGLSADLASTGEFAVAQPGSLDFWLLERYRLFVGQSERNILAADVEHPPWRAAVVKVVSVRHDLSEMLGLGLADTPALVHESPGVAATFKAFRVVAEAGSRVRVGAEHRVTVSGS